MLTSYPSYSSLFHTLYDEPAPTAELGRGAHYSILSAPQWEHPLKGDRMTLPLIQRIGVIWDEDHDTRVIQTLEAGYMNNLLAPVIFIGERKAALTVVIRDDADVDGHYEHNWGNAIERVLEDCWSLEIVHVKDVVQAQMIHDHRAEVVATYLANIRNLWQLGMHAHLSQRFESQTPGVALVEFTARN